MIKTHENRILTRPVPRLSPVASLTCARQWGGPPGPRGSPPGPAPSVESTRVGGRGHIASLGNIFRTTIIAEYRAPIHGYEYEANTLTGRASLRSLPDLTGRACPDDTAGERPGPLWFDCRLSAGLERQCDFEREDHHRQHSHRPVARSGHDG